MSTQSRPGPSLDDERRQSTYRYEPLLTESGSTRVLDLQPAKNLGDPLLGRVRIVSHAECEYDALSYAWGDPEAVDTVEIGGYTLGIAKNLSDFLRNLRLPSEEITVWVDSICINQGDVTERNAQVRQMNLIYTNARSVIGWLGERGPDTHSAIALLDELTFALEKPTGIDHATIHTLTSCWEKAWLGLIDLLERSFWSRLWIIQEVSINRNFVLRIGPHPERDSFDLHQFRHVVKTVKTIIDASYKNSHLTYTLGQVQRARTAADSIQLLVSIRAAYPVSHGDFYHFMNSLFFGNVCASNRHDYVYGLFGLFREPPVTVDYEKTIEEVFVDVLEFIQRQDSQLDFLSCTRQHAANSPKGSPSIPSWCPDWSVRRAAGITMISLVNYYDEPGGRRIFSASEASRQKVRIDRSTRTLYAKGFVFSKVVRVGNPCHHTLGNEWLWPPDWGPTVGLHEIKPPSMAYIEEIFIQEVKVEEEMRPGLQDLIYPSHRLLQWWKTLTAEMLRGVLGGAFKKDIQIPPSDGLQLTQLLNALASLTQPYHERRMAATENDGMALVPDAAMEGDLICILYGGSVPYVIRPVRDSEGFEFIGDCYIYGAMDGEQMKTPGLEQEFAFHG